MQFQRTEDFVYITHQAACSRTRQTTRAWSKRCQWLQIQFLGGRAGWEVLGLPATVESTVLLSPDGQTSIKEFHRKLGNTSLPDTTDLILPNEVRQPLLPGDTSF